MIPIKVYKGNVVPVRNPAGGVLLVTESPGPDVFERYLEYLRDFLVEAAKLAGLKDLPSEEKLEFLADMVTLFYKAPLLREPLSGMHLSPFKVYVLYRVLRSLNQGLRRKSMKEILTSLTGEEIERSFDGLFALMDEAADLAESILLGYPADTRPGYNVSSLMIHWISVSALAWAKGYSLGLERRKLARIRVASLLHDIGKPLNPKKHVEEGVKVVGWLLSDLIDKEDLEEILRLIKLHHSKTASDEEVQVIREADHFSSGMDRLEALVRRVVLKELASITGKSEEEALKEYYVSGSWEAWERLEEANQGITRRLTEKCVRALILREVDDFPEGRTFGGVSVVKLDVASIQGFVRESEKLPLLAASSYIVDLAVMFNSLRAVQERLLGRGAWYPVEGFLYSAGGNVLAVVPQELVAEFGEILRESFKAEGEHSLGFGPLSVRVASTELKSNYGEMIRELDRGLRTDKISLSGPIQGDLHMETSFEGLTGLERVCDYCKRRPAVKAVDMEGETFHLCSECYDRYSLYSKGNVRSKWRRATTSSGKTIKDVFGASWHEEVNGREVKDYIMEIISGHDLEREERLLNLATLKIDGNLMGAFMARSVSLSDALERSARVDLALKRAFRKALKSLNEGLRPFGEEADKEEARLILGLQYMGGDDSLIFAPSWASVPLALVLMVEFAREMGYSFMEEECASTGATISVGLAVAPARHNIWALLDAAEELLSEAKEVGRYPNFMGSIAFDAVEGGLLSGRAARARKEELERLRLTAQPWVIRQTEVSCDPLWSIRERPEAIAGVKPPRGGPDLMRFMSSLLGVNYRDPVSSSDEELESFYSKLFEEVFREYLHHRRGEGKDERIKKLRDAVRDVEAFPERFDVSPGEEGFGSLALLYAASEAKEKEVYKLVLNLFTPEVMALEDVNRLCKIMLGGTR